MNEDDREEGWKHMGRKNNAGYGKKTGWKYADEPRR
jgi:hypothetical protein